MKKTQQDSSSPTPSQGDSETHSAPGQRIFFTGPDGIGDFRPRMDYFPRSIGTRPFSPDATSDLSYLFRPAPCAPPPLPKHSYTGGVGWGLHFSTAINRPTNSHKTHGVISPDRSPSSARDAAALSSTHSSNTLRSGFLQLRVPPAGDGFQEVGRVDERKLFSSADQ